MARPLIGEFALNETFNCKLSETESSMLGSLSYTMGCTKSEVVRLFIRYAYVMLSDMVYRVYKEAEKKNEKLAPEEISKRILENIEQEYQKYFDTENLEKDDFLVMTVGDIPVKVSGKVFVLDKKGKKFIEENYKLNKALKNKKKLKYKV